MLFYRFAIIQVNNPEQLAKGITKFRKRDWMCEIFNWFWVRISENSRSASVIFNIFFYYFRVIQNQVPNWKLFRVDQNCLFISFFRRISNKNPSRNGWEFQVKNRRNTDQLNLFNNKDDWD
jgi:hypothetical protein